MRALFFILLFYMLGGVVSAATSGLLPASIAGMVLLFLALIFKLVKARTIKPATDFLLKNLMLFFVPIAVGVVGSFTLFEGHLVAIVVSSLVSTVIVIGVVGVVAQGLIRCKKR